MGKRIAVILGHPDPSQAHFDDALASAYAEGARAGGHLCTVLDVGTMEFPLVRTARDFAEGSPPLAIAAAQQTIASAEHLVVVYPLWLGDVPAVLKGFFEQVFRPTFPGAKRDRGPFPRMLDGKSVRIVVTMGMPAIAYRWFFGAHSLKSLARNVFGFTGARPVRATVFGAIEAGGARRHAAMLARMRRLGHKAA